jgi:AcrR family transcriptional regulator
MSFTPLTPERRREMTRQHLLEAAAIVFARDGFHGATIDKIAELAGFTKGAVYSNFKNKDDLFLALLDERAAREYALMSAALERGPEDTDTRFNEASERVQIGSAFWDEPWTMLYLEFVLYALRNPDARDKLVAQVEREFALEQQLIQNEYDVIGVAPPYPIRSLAVVTSSMFLGMQLKRLITPSAVDQTTIDTALEMLLVAMGAPDPTVEK